MLPPSPHLTTTLLGLQYSDQITMERPHLRRSLLGNPKTIRETKTRTLEESTSSSNSKQLNSYPYKIKSHTKGLSTSVPFT